MTKLQQIIEKLKAHSDFNEFARDVCDAGLAESRSEGRAMWFKLKKYRVPESDIVQVHVPSDTERRRAVDPAANATDGHEPSNP
jgi:hypothetical protein